LFSRDDEFYQLILFYVWVLEQVLAQISQQAWVLEQA
jgi:hypothetical protein